MPTTSTAPSIHPVHTPEAKHVLKDPYAFPLNDSKLHLLLCASGSVATIKIPSIINALSAHPSISIRLILTTSASAFLADQSAEQPSLAALAALPHVDGIYLDEDEWRDPWTRGNKILHIELRRWADLMVVAPLSANSLAKMASGLCDNLLLSTIRAWDTTGLLDPVREPPRPNPEPAENGVAGGEGVLHWGQKKIIIVAPAMNTAMWKHPITKQHIKLLEGEWGVKNGGWIEVLKPVEKELACGDTGVGAMRDWKEIVHVIEERFGLEGVDLL
ncbi:phosphopantothenoylcysteine decarboxylase [Glonium stellatum]|uniref:Phosphopantothenoylcysteine decarboxylase n=1 Tax=Glonium stellatum TaxID=574774 RepID=A0A8E2JN88_9PEZI|nr:phosphopantothenoylcysteine decarboxylase [Glonium stellatum]